MKEINTIPWNSTAMRLQAYAESYLSMAASRGWESFPSYGKIGANLQQLLKDAETAQRNAPRRPVVCANGVVGYQSYSLWCYLVTWERGLLEAKTLFADNLTEQGMMEIDCLLSDLGEALNADQEPTAC